MPQGVLPPFHIRNLQYCSRELLSVPRQLVCLHAVNSSHSLSWQPQISRLCQKPPRKHLPDNLQPPFVDGEDPTQAQTGWRLFRDDLEILKVYAASSVWFPVFQQPSLVHRGVLRNIGWPHRQDILYFAGGLLHAILESRTSCGVHQKVISQRPDGHYQNTRNPCQFRKSKTPHPSEHSSASSEDVSTPLNRSINHCQKLANRGANVRNKGLQSVEQRVLDNGVDTYQGGYSVGKRED